MRNTTLCYLSVNGKTLLLHRTKKENDLNEGMWIGIGGGMEENESPEEGMLREFKEETGLTLTSFRYRGIVTFCSDKWEGEYMHLFSADGYTGSLIECDEGDLEWIENDRVPQMPTWEGDRLFLGLMLDERPFFSLKLVYQGSSLISAVLDGKDLSL